MKDIKSFPFACVALKIKQTMNIKYTDASSFINKRCL